jgi:hypothetical protein
MKENATTIDPMKMVTVEITEGRDADQAGLVPEPLEERFIFGIGASGLSPFEMILSGRTVGETVNFSVPAAAQFEFFGHVIPPCLQPPKGVQTLHYTARVKAIRPADGKEVIKALAAQTGCGDGCDCGCGGH